MGGGESKPIPTPPYMHARKPLHDRFRREKAKIENEIQIAKIQLSERIEEIEEQLTDIEKSTTHEKFQGIERQFRDLKHNFLQDVRTVENDKDTTFDKLFHQIEEIEQQRQTSRVDWEELDDLTVRMTMFYSKYVEELDKLEKCIKTEKATIPSRSLPQSQGIENTLSLFEKGLSLHGAGASFLSSPLEDMIETPEFVLEEPVTPKDEREMDNSSWTNSLTFDESGRSFDFSKVGFLLEIPRGAVRQNTELWYSVAESFVPSPLGEFESLVSYVVHLGPGHVLLRKPIIITLMHSGIVNLDAKVYDEDSHQWKILKEYTRSSLKRNQVNVNSVKVPLTKLTAVAVVSRVLKSTDTFQVSPSGCVVRSSLCNVTVHFPRGAVDKTVMGSIKVLPMPDVFIPVETEDYPCPFLFIDGFEGITFSKYVTVEMPHPCPARYPLGKISLLCLKNNEWSEISSEKDSVVCIEKSTTVELHVRHFSGLWPWLPFVPLSFVVLYECVCKPQQTVCFAAFKENSQFALSPKITLMCVANNEQDKIDEMRGRGYTRLACETVTEGMRPGAKAYLDIKGSFRKRIGTQQDLCLQFVKGEICRKELEIERNVLKQDPRKELTLSCYQETAKQTLLCELHCHENKSQEAGRANLPRVMASLEDTNEVYKMESSPRGLMVIINIDKFQEDGLADRRGSEKDVQSLNRLFYGYLDFKVKIMLNKAGYEVLKQLREISENEDHRKYDCLAVCIMSHGDENCFYATDGDKITVQEVVSMFTNTQCAVFRRKPKLFFIQACRGEKGRGYALNHVSDSIGVDAQLVRQRDSDMSDILIAYSSYEGYAAFRNIIDGSFFIQCLVRVLRQYSDREHLVEMLTRVNKEVHDLVDDDVAGRTQVPVPTSTLRKKLYFFPESL